MRAHLVESDLGIERIARQSGLSPYHFMRVFRAATGSGVHGYLVQLRLAHARELLLGGEDAAAAAVASGFADQSHLIRHFRASYGSTPARYLRATKGRALH
jgi:AraC-like DNA-binding protein